MSAPLAIVVDTREQAPYGFARFPAVEIVRAGLPTGDYSLTGHEVRAAIERKSLDDLLGCLTGGRDRFERELARAPSPPVTAGTPWPSWQDDVFWHVQGY